MKKFKKTYAIYNLTEKHTSFFLGKTRVQVSFTGGIVTKKGVTPATFTTEDPVVQFAIENSADFKKGTITLRSKYPMQGEVKVGKNPPDEPTATTAPAMPKADIIREAAANVSDADTATAEPEKEEIPEPGPVCEAADEGDEASEQPQKTDVAGSGEEKDHNLEVIEVSCRDVAKQYLQEHYDENPTPLRTIANIQECAAKYGITFNFV